MKNIKVFRIGKIYVFYEYIYVYIIDLLENFKLKLYFCLIYMKLFIGINVFRDYRRLFLMNKYMIFVFKNFIVWYRG